MISALVKWGPRVSLHACSSSAPRKGTEKRMIVSLFEMGALLMILLYRTGKHRLEFIREK